MLKMFQKVDIQLNEKLIQCKLAKFDIVTRIKQIEFSRGCGWISSLFNWLLPNIVSNNRILNIQNINKWLINFIELFIEKIPKFKAKSKGKADKWTCLLNNTFVRSQFSTYFKHATSCKAKYSYDSNDKWCIQWNSV